MRIVTFSDEQVIDFMGRNFICVWTNIRPSEKFKDGLYEGSEERLLKSIRPGTGDTNICGFVASADGKILHAIQGYTDAKGLIAELKFGLEAAESKDLSRLYRKRSAEVAARENRNAADQLLKKNLDRLAEKPLPTLDSLKGAKEAGLKK